MDLKAVNSETFTLKSDLPNTIGILAFRFPGTDSPDYAATRVLIDVLASERSNLYRMESSGKTLDVDFDFAETYPKASIGYGLLEVTKRSECHASHPQYAKDPGRICKRGRAGRPG